jgi:hypothetical protein
MATTWCSIVLSLLSQAPAEAHCFSVWHYNVPQRCGGAVRHAPSATPMPPDRAYAVSDMPDGWGIDALWEAIARQDTGQGGKK